VNKETGKLVRQRMTAREEYIFVAAAKRGDSAAFETLCKQATSTVLHVAWRMMRNNEDAEDVLQESFQQAFIYLGSFNGASRFSTWLTRIAINAALMRLRKKNRLRDVSLDEPVETEESSTHFAGSAWGSARSVSRTAGDTRHISQNHFACNA
jgi:RNA polymerase sigma factor (sigma-70 family)